MQELPRQLDAALAAWIGDARWYSAKGSTAARLVLHDAVVIPQGWLALVDRIAADTGAEGSSSVRYVLPISGRDGTLVDAGSSAGFARWLLDVVFGRRAVDGLHGTFRGRLAGPAVAPAEADQAITAQTLGGDASNTSLLVRGKTAAWVCKLVRTCRPGEHPEVEIGRRLAAHGWAGSPRLIGWLEYEPRGGAGEPAVVAVVHDYVAECRSAWDVLLERATSDWDGSLLLAEELGRTTASMHTALAAGDGPAFAVEPWSPSAAQGAGVLMVDHARQVFDRLAARVGSWPAPLADRFEHVFADRGRLIERLAVFPEAAVAAGRIRVHGDYHLGQVLVQRTEAGDRCFVIDFEGEPARSLAERREKTSAAKDVAGMCRSFDYLLRFLNKTGKRPFDERDRRAIEARFQTAYQADARGHAWWPANPADAERLLAVFTIDKAIYELAYEADNRPDWIDVPLAALEAMECVSR